VKQVVPLPIGSDEAVVEAIWRGVTPSTKVLYFSHVTSTTALALPAAKLCRRAREAGILSVVDGAHVPGHLPLDLSRLGADVYVGNCHKWLCAPKGSAFMWVQPELHERLDASVISWGYSTAVTGHTAFDGYLGTTLLERRHQWQGTRDISAFLTVPAAVDFQREHGWDEVRRRCHELAVDIGKRLRALTGLEPIAPERSFSQMVAIPLPPCDAEALKSALYDRFRVEVPITAHAGRALLRVSVQGYNDEGDADALVRAIATLLGERGSPFDP
jgi:isopenicillin-N epimerase